MRSSSDSVFMFLAFIIMLFAINDTLRSTNRALWNQAYWLKQAATCRGEK